MALTVLVGGSVASGQDTGTKALTIDDPQIPVDELELMLQPLTRDQLVVEADGWLALLQAKVTEVSAAELAIKHQNKRIEAAEDAEGETEEQAEVKTDLLEGLTQLREERTALIDRLNVVLAELELKGGAIDDYTLYVDAISGFTVDVSDASATWTTIVGWLKSPEGGVRWGLNVVKALVTLLVFWILSKVVGQAVRRAMAAASNTSDLLRDFMTRLSQRVVFFAGVLVAITMLEVKLGPVLAIIGAAGFVVAFALQGTLSNFASGLMILAYRPFDVGSVISVAGTIGTVESMNLVSTHIKTADNQRVIIPNNSIWGNVITNITGLPTRRVDLVFGISYSDDAAKAISILESIVREHPLVLADPAPVVKLHELADSSVNFVCRPWVKTSDYWAVYWDVTRLAKERFDAEGISIPFPQQDVHVHQVEPAV
jgi:small conductance mechanosensitive channel